ncbi:hypothetical protein EP7_002568 [Isosphaeraceae bacterium EP7]
MQTRPHGWFDSAKTPEGWAYTLPTSAREPIPWFNSLGRFVLCLVAGGYVLMIDVPTTMRRGWASREAFLVLVCLTILASVPSLVFNLLRRLAGRDELTLDAVAIRATWRLGPLSWSTTARRSDVAQFTVTREGGGGHLLAAEDDFGRMRILGGNYSREMLMALAVELSTRWKELPIDPDFVEVGPGKLAVREHSNVSTGIRERRDLPAGSRLTIEHLVTGETRIIRPRKGFRVFESTNVTASGIGVLIFALSAALLPFLGLPVDSTKLDQFSNLFCSGLLLIYLCVFVVLSTRDAISSQALTVTPDSLTLETKGLRGTSRRTWKSHEIASIRADTRLDDSGDGSGGRQTRVLIFGNDPIGQEPDILMSGPAAQAKPDMEYIATTLRTLLGVPASDLTIGG